MHTAVCRAGFVVALALSCSIVTIPSAGATSADDAATESPIRPEITGFVIDSQGEPMPEARVEIAPLPDSFTTSMAFLEGVLPSFVARGRSDAAGRFRLAAPEPGIYRLVVRAEGHVAMQQRPLVLLGDTELAPVRLLPDTGLDLRLTTAAGQPAAGAWAIALVNPQSHFVARAWAPQATRGWRPHPRFARTNDAGRTRLSRAADEPLDLHFPGAPIERAVTSSLDLRLAVTEPRRLTVTDATGRALAGVLALPGTRPWPAGVTDADGRITLSARSGESLDVLLLAADGRRQRQRIEPQAAPSILALPDPRAVAGQVVDADSGKPIAGAWVWPVGDPGRHARGDRDGNYRLLLPPESQTLQAEAPGYVPTVFELASVTDLADRQHDAHQGPVQHRFALHRAVGLTGRVSDPEGHALADVHLEALATADHERSFLQTDRVDQRAVSQRDGRFTIHRLEAGVTYHFRASAPGFAPEAVIFTAPRSVDARSRLDLVLRPRIDVVGRVVDLSDQGLAGARVELNISGSAFDSGHRAESGADGHFEISGVPAGTFDLRGHRSGFAPAVVRGLAIASGERRFDLGTLVLGPGTTIDGLVINAGGEAITGARVHVFPSVGPNPGEATLAEHEPDAVSANDGRFSVVDLAPGDQVDLWVDRHGYLATRVQRVQAPNTEPVVLRLERAFQVSGRVVDGTGKGIPGARISLDAQDVLPGSGGRLRAGRSVSRHGITSADGHFELTEVPTGDAAMHVEAEGYIALESHPLSMPAADVDSLELVLERGATLQGFVASGGEPVPGTRVSAGAASAVSDAEGFYHLAGVRPGPVEVDAVHPDYLPVQEALTLNNDIERLDLELPEGRPVSGQVVDETGWPVAGAAVRLSGYHRGRPLDYRADSAADGTFRFATVGHSHYRVTARREGYALAERELPLKVADAPIDDLTLVLSRGATVSGRVIGLSFDELSRVGVNAAQAGQRIAGLMDYAGEFRIEGLGTGDWTVRAHLDEGRRQAKKRVEVTSESGDLVLDLEFGGELTLTGQVLQAGAVLPDTRISLAGLDVDYERSVVTDHAGTFRIEDLRHGTYRLGVVNAEEYLMHNQTLKLEDDRHLDLDLRGTDVSGQVSAAGQPVVGALVVLERQVDQDGAVAFIVTGDTDADGAFHLPRVPAGAFQLTARRDGYGQAEQHVRVPATGDLSELHIELEPTRGMMLDVRLTSGGIPTGVHLQVADAGGRPFLNETRTPDPMGRVSFPTVPAGHWQLEIGAPGAATVKTSITVPGDPLPIVLPTAGRLEVRIPALTDADLTATVRLHDTTGSVLKVVEVGGRQRTNWPLRGGKAEIDGVPAKAWTVVVIEPSGHRWQGAVTTPGRGVATVVLE